MRKRSLSLKGHRTSVCLEETFWDSLEAFAREDNRSLPSLNADIDKSRLTEPGAPGLASALRVYAHTRVKALVNGLAVRNET